jgi:hypothetical protein
MRLNINIREFFGVIFLFILCVFIYPGISDRWSYFGGYTSPAFDAIKIFSSFLTISVLALASVLFLSQLQKLFLMPVLIFIIVPALAVSSLVSEWGVQISLIFSSFLFTAVFIISARLEVAFLKRISVSFYLENRWLSMQKNFLVFVFLILLPSVLIFYEVKLDFFYCLIFLFLWK